MGGGAAQPGSLTETLTNGKSPETVPLCYMSQHNSRSHVLISVNSCSVRNPEFRPASARKEQLFII